MDPLYFTQPTGNYMFKVRNMFKINYRDIKMTSMKLLWPLLLTLDICHTFL